METLALEMRHLAYDSDRAIDYAYFPLTCVISMVCEMADGATVEVATIGNEGMVGLPLFLGVTRTAGKAFTQVRGDGIRIPAKVFQEKVLESGPLSRVLQLYTQALMVQISQGIACNAVHSSSQRCARWLLMTHDRVGTDTFALSQEFLGQMLGVRRQGVNAIANEFRDKGMITYSRGVIKILNRRKLEQAACECYGVIAKEFRRLLGTPQKQ